MNKVLFECKKFKIRVKDVVIMIILLLLLFFGLKMCHKDDTTQKKKEEKIKNVCGVSNENINDLNTLLSRADLCSDEWFNDLDAYILRIEEQNDLLEEKKDTQSKAVYQLQDALLEDLQDFKETQDAETIDALESATKEYMEYFDKNCKN